MSGRSDLLTSLGQGRLNARLKRPLLSRRYIDCRQTVSVSAQLGVERLPTAAVACRLLQLDGNIDQTPVDGGMVSVLDAYWKSVRQLRGIEQQPSL